MQSFFASVLIKVLSDPKVQALLLQIVDRLAAILLPKLAAVIPAAVAAGIKALGDIIPNLDIPGLDDLTEVVRGGINGLLPKDIDIPILSDAFEKATGFDLSDIITGRNKP